ncbi:MAG: signal peptidase I [Omnitrophica bacterium RIFCSPHIGHO2_02_FULL_63_14]|nr:MAG: signal peptidase I [Omnitrophica bacterium RIFCSPHIGHO2_02_FULL_63_14]
MGDREYWLREGREWGQSLIIALVVTLIVRTYVIQAFKIPSGSMRPTFLEGDKIFVNKYIYRFKDPQRGDIVVFRFPDKTGGKKKDFIKRLAGLEGDKVEIRDGRVIVNGQELNDPGTFGKFYYYNAEPYGGPYDQIRVPEDSFYVLGDNSSNSTDSRYWGFVPRKNVLGKAVFRWWPPKRMGRIT